MFYQRIACLAMTIIGVVALTLTFTQMDQSNKNKNIWGASALVFIIALIIWGACIKAHKYNYDPIPSPV